MEMEMEIGTIESFRFILSPARPAVVNRPRRRRPARPAAPAPTGNWQPLFLAIPAGAPRTTSRRSASARKRKAIRHSLAQRVPAGWLTFVHTEYSL